MPTRMMFLVASTLALCACVSGLAVGENQAAPTPLAYETFADAGQYFFVSNSLNWTDASEVCRGYNGHLAYPKTQDEADALWSIMTRHNIKQIHAGFHDQFIEGAYYTAKGRLLNETSFNKWSSGAPVGGSSRNCGGLKNDGLVDVACNSSYPSICEENPPPREPGEPVGFRDYTYIESLKSYYRRYAYRDMTWAEGMKACYEDGAHLVIFNSEREHSIVTTKYFYNFPPYLPVGVHHFHAIGYFVTIFDDTLNSTGFSTWERDPIAIYNRFPIVLAGKKGLYTAGATMILSHIVCEYNP